MFRAIVGENRPIWPDESTIFTRSRIVSRTGSRKIERPGHGIALPLDFAFETKRAFPDCRAGGASVIERLEARMNAEARDKCGLSELEGQTLQRTLRKGWYWGGEAFKEALLERLDQVKGKQLPVAKDFRSSGQARDHAIRDAETIISEAARHFGMKSGGQDDFAALPRGDLRRVAVAWALSRKTSLRQSWIAERLSVRSAGNVSEQVRKFATIPEKDLPKEVRTWRTMNQRT